VDASLLDVASWTVVGTAPGTPWQLSGVDCGVFACYFAYFASVDAPLAFDQRSIPHYRRRMTIDLLHGTLE
jgi:sentrin-specific protease 1